MTHYKNQIATELRGYGALTEKKIFGFCSLPAVELLAWFRNKPKSVFAPWVLRIPVAPWQCGFYVFPNFLDTKNRCLRDINLRQRSIVVSAPGGARTPNLLIRSQMLYPIALRARTAD